MCVRDKKIVCVNINCNNEVQIRHILKSGKLSYKSLCSFCYKYRNNPEALIKKGIIQVKKNYCENQDGRLGFKCYAKELKSYQLELDHIDGDHYNNTPENVLTICSNCHRRKTQENNDCNGNKYKTQETAMISEKIHYEQDKDRKQLFLAVDRQQESKRNFMETTKIPL